MQRVLSIIKFYEKDFLKWIALKILNEHLKCSPHEYINNQMKIFNIFRYLVIRKKIPLNPIFK